MKLAQRARTAHHQRLGGEYLHDLGGADAPRPGADASTTGGVRITADIGAAWQSEADMGTDNMHDAMIAIVYVE